MILFILIVVAEMLICAFRSTRKNTVRLICNVGSVILSGAIILIMYVTFKRSFSDMAGFDPTLGGNLTKSDAGKLDSIITAFVTGVAFSVLYAVIYWIFKIISLIVTKIVMKNKDNSDSVSEPSGTGTSFNPVGLIFGLVIGLICAGFTIMPYTGLQQLFTDKESVEAVTGLVTTQAGATPGKLVKVSSSPRALTLSKFTGIGFVTNGIFNTLTTAKTEAGKESLVEFAVPYLNNINDFLPFGDENAEFSELMHAGSKALDVFGMTKLFSEEEKLNMIKYAVNKNVPDVPVPGSRSLGSLSEDVSYAANIVEVFEKAVPHSGRNDLIDSIDIEKIDLDHDDIVKLADNLYSMNEGAFYVNLLLDKVFGSNSPHIDTDNDAFRATKPDFIEILESAMKLKNVISVEIDNIENIDIDELKDTVKSIKDSDLISEEDFHEIIDNVKETIKESNIDLEEIKKLPELKDIDLSGYDSIDDIPDSVIDAWLESH